MIKFLPRKTMETSSYSPLLDMKNALSKKITQDLNQEKLFRERALNNNRLYT